MTNQSHAPVDLDGFRNTMRTAGIEEIVEPTLQLYATDTPAILEGLEHATQSGDSARTAELAHALKSSSGAIHAHVLAALLTRLEIAGCAAETATMASLFPQVRDEHRRVVVFVNSAVERST